METPPESTSRSEVKAAANDGIEMLPVIASDGEPDGFPTSDGNDLCAASE